MRPDFGISDEEYEERRSAFALCTWINAKLQALRESGHFDAVYFERTGRNVKRLIEEAIPLSRLALYLSCPEHEVAVQCFADNRNYDAEIEITGFSDQSFKVEVTTAESETSTLRRQALARAGFVHLTGSIRRIGRRIVSEGEMVDVQEEEARTVALLLERLRDKVEKGRYDTGTAFLVYASEFRPLGMDARAELVRSTEQYLAGSPISVPAVYYCFWPDYSIVHAAPPR